MQKKKKTGLKETCPHFPFKTPPVKFTGGIYFRSFHLTVRLPAEIVEYLR